MTLQPADATAQAGQVQVLITNDGVHPPEKWAKLTTNQLVEISPTMPAERRPLAEKLRERLYATLLAGFNEVRKDMTADEIDRLARQVVSRCADHARGTPWELSFTAQSTSEMLVQTVRRNLFSAADIALMTE